MWYWIINISFAMFLYLGVIKDIEGAGNVFIAMNWLALFGALFGADKDTTRKMASVGRPWYIEVFDHIYDIVSVVVLIWYGWFWMAAVNAWSTILIEMKWADARKLRRDKNDKRSSGK